MPTWHITFLPLQIRRTWSDTIFGNHKIFGKRNRTHPLVVGYKSIQIFGPDPWHNRGLWSASGKYRQIYLCFSPFHHITSSPQSAAYMRQWTGSALVQIMTCRLFGAKPLPEPMLLYCQLDPYEQTSVKFQSRYKTFHSQKCIWKCRLRKWWPFCPGGDDLIGDASLASGQSPVNLPSTTTTNTTLCIVYRSLIHYYL